MAERDVSAFVRDLNALCRTHRLFVSHEGFALTVKDVDDLEEVGVVVETEGALHNENPTTVSVKTGMSIHRFHFHNDEDGRAFARNAAKAVNADVIFWPEGTPGVICTMHETDEGGERVTDELRPQDIADMLDAIGEETVQETATPCTDHNLTDAGDSCCGRERKRVKAFAKYDHTKLCRGCATHWFVTMAGIEMRGLL